MPIELDRWGNGLELLFPETARSCPTCEIYTHPWEDWTDTSKKIKEDWSCSCEGLDVVSQKVKDIIEDHGVPDVDFFPLSNGCYLFRPRKRLFLDVSDALQRTEEHCKTCGRMTAFLGEPADYKLLKGQKPVAFHEIVRSAQEWGGAPYMVPSIILGDEIAGALNYEGLRGGLVWTEIS